MVNILLEFDSLKIIRPKKRWKLYFVVVTEHPTEADKMVVTTVPSNNTIELKPPQHNQISFEPKGEGADGLFILQRPMPVDRTIKVRVYLRHSRKGLRSAGDTLQDIKNGLGSQAAGTITDILGVTGAPWLVISKTAVGLLGEVLAKIKDRDFGFVSMDEEFGPEFENQTELDRENNFSTGQASIAWSWATMN